MSVPATGVVVLANGLSGMGWPESVGDLYWKVLVLLAAISVPVYAWEDMRESTTDAVVGTEPEASEPGSAAPNSLDLFLARLSGPLPGQLLCLEMQDHYLAVHTTGGTEMILCRMEDAARELDGIGRRVHRSWWVAADAVESAPRNGQRQFLRLVDGRSVPVGRSFKSELRESGWL